MPPEPPSDRPAGAPQPARPDIRTVDARELFGEGREVVLIHLGEAYRLRITARDRLILTK